MRDAAGDMFSFPGVVGTIWLGSVEDPDASLSFVIFETREAMEANGKDPRFRKGLEPMAAVAEKLPPGLHTFTVDMAKLKGAFGETP